MAVFHGNPVIEGMDQWRPDPTEIQKAFARLQEEQASAIQTATRIFDAIQPELSRIAIKHPDLGREAVAFLVERARDPATSSCLAFAARFETQVGVNSGRNIRAALSLCASDMVPDSHYPPFLAAAMRQGIADRYGEGKPLVGADIFSSLRAMAQWEEHWEPHRRAIEKTPEWEAAWRPPVADISRAPASDRSFGVEIEGYFLDARAPSDQARLAFDQLSAAGMEPARGAGGPGQWAVRLDGSIRSPACVMAGGMKGGVEIVSPVLRGAEGLAQYARVSGILAGAGFRSDGMPSVDRPRTCGFHVHVGWPETGVEPLRRLAMEWVNREPQFSAGLAPGRERSKAARSARRALGPTLREALWAAGTEAEIIALMSPTRDWSLNLQNLAAPQRARTVEFRARHGWSGGEEAWISQCVDLVEEAASGGPSAVLARARERGRESPATLEAAPCR